MKAWLTSEVHSLGRSLESAQQVHSLRREMILRIEIDGVVGIGLGSPQPEEILGDAGFDAVWQRLRSGGLRRLGDALLHRKGFTWGHVRSLFGDSAADRAAAALCESALLDIECGGSPTHWRSLFGGERSESQWTVGLAESEWSIPEEVTRVRVKCDLNDLGNLERLNDVKAPILLDANGSTLPVSSITELWRQFSSDCSVVAVEQAWGVGDFAVPAELRRHGVRTSHDESIRSILDVRHASRYAAADVLCLKPFRLGGVSATRQAADIARSNGLEVYLGGFFESPLGRFRNECIAQDIHAGPSDILAMRGERVTEEEARGEWHRFDEIARDRGEQFEWGG